MSAYQHLKERFAHIQRLTDATALLNVDSQKAIPVGSRAAREAQIVAIKTAAHTAISDPQVQEWLARAESDAGKLSAADQRNLVLMRREWIHRALLPADLAAEKARLEIEGLNLHVAHKRTGSWDDMKDHYAHSFAILRECGAVKKEALGVGTAYEALLDEFSIGVREDMLDREFAVVDRVLPQIVQEAHALQATKPEPLPVQGTFPVRQQHKLNKIIAQHIGFDFSRGRMVDNDNYMTDGGSDDCYITTAYDKNNVFDGFIMHETGHGLYVQGLPREFALQPAGNYLGLAVHEMTAMIIECHAAATPGFFQFLAYQMQHVFNRHADSALMPENLQALNRRTQPSFIRMLADELTYPLHLTLRYGLERDMIAGKLDVARDLPEAWNEGFKARFGITPPDPKQGCMQDQHWPGGSIGYFPDYILGRMGAAQLFAAAARAHPTIAHDDMPALKSWMTENVYSKGSLLPLDDLFTQATGEKLNAQPLFDHLSRKFLGKPYIA